MHRICTVRGTRVPTDWVRVPAILEDSFGQDSRRIRTSRLRPRPSRLGPILIWPHVAFWGTCHNNAILGTTGSCNLPILALFYPLRTYKLISAVGRQKTPEKGFESRDIAHSIWYTSWSQSCCAKACHVRIRYSSNYRANPSSSSRLGFHVCIPTE
jgi:hypothetical protein